MRRVGYLLLSIAILASITACGSAGRNVMETQGLKRNLDTEQSQAESEVRKTEVVGSPAVQTGENDVSNDSRVLIAYFSRWGNTDFPDEVDAVSSASILADENGRYGTTEYVARMIQGLTGGELYLIQTDSPYPADYEAVISQNHDEMDQDILPALRNSTLDMERYDVLFIGYPIWATDIPQAVRAFFQGHDYTGKTVIPFCTHGGYGAGNSYETIADLCPGADVLDGLAVNAEDVHTAQDMVTQWLKALELPASTGQNE